MDDGSGGVAGYGGLTGAAGRSGAGGAANGAGGSGLGGSAGGAGAAGRPSGGTGGTGEAGSAGGGGFGGGPAGPLFSCIDGWPNRPAGSDEKGTSLIVNPTTLWTKVLPASTAAGAIGRGMAVTGTGFALTSGYTLLIYDGDGNLTASVEKPQESGYISTPVSGSDGTLYFADSVAAYRVDGKGKSIWETPLGVNQVVGSGAPRQPALDPVGRLHISAMDGKVWTIRAEDGQAISTADLGLRRNAPRYISGGFGNVQLVDRAGITSSGADGEAYGLMTADTGLWVGEVIAPWYIIAGYEIGVVISRAFDLSIYDKCGSFRWKVPGSYAGPAAVTFNDDLIVIDRTPTGSGVDSIAFRRFSKDGELRAGPVPSTDIPCGSSFVGADDTFYYIGYTQSGPSQGYRLWAFDSALNQKWVIPFPFCPDAAVLAEGGKIFAARLGQLAAIQTTSPGPGRVSWGQNAHDARATRWLGP